MFALLIVAAATWTELMQSGNASLDRGQLAEAAASFEAALRVASAGHERAAALNNLATVEDSRGNLTRAERLYKECIEAWARVESSTFDALAKPLNNLAVLYRRRGEYKKAAELYERSLAMRPGSPVVLNNLGRMAWMQGQHERAEEYYQRALASSPRDSATLVNLAELQLSLHRLDAAERTAFRVLPAEDGRPLEVIARLTLAGVARERKLWNEADEQLKRAGSIAATALGEYHPLTACVLAEHAHIARKLKRNREAELYEERARAAIAASPVRHTVSLSELLEQRH